MQGLWFKFVRWQMLPEFISKMKASASFSISPDCIKLQQLLYPSGTEVSQHWPKGFNHLDEESEHWYCSRDLGSLVFKINQHRLNDIFAHMVYKRTLRCKQKILLKKLTPPSQVLQEIGLILAEIPQGERISNISQTASELFGVQLRSAIQVSILSQKCKKSSSQNLWNAELNSPKNLVWAISVMEPCFIFFSINTLYNKSCYSHFNLTLVII